MKLLLPIIASLAIILLFIMFCVIAYWSLSTIIEEEEDIENEK
jgi:uncharacterized membrane protein YwzB